MNLKEVSFSLMATVSMSTAYTQICLKQRLTSIDSAASGISKDLAYSAGARRGYAPLQPLAAADELLGTACLRLACLQASARASAS